MQITKQNIVHGRLVAASVVIISVISLAFFRTAWVSEDAFITFRVVDNLLNGFGPTWNPGERVQAYTHPLWFGLLVWGVGLFEDPYWVSLALSYVFTLATLLVLLRIADGNNPSALLAIVALAWSRAFIDFSSSGLENPLTHTLIALFVWAWLKCTNDKKRSLVLMLLASGLFLTRPDTGVLIAPALGVWFWQCRTQLARHIVPILVGALPAIVWVVFSMIYYGAPAPNTAFAKVQTGLSYQQHAIQAWHYVAWTVQTDFVTAAILLGGITLGSVMGGPLLRPLAAGLILWLGYLFYIGADYMAGRFFSASTVMSVATIAAALNARPIRGAALVIATLLAVKAGTLATTVFASEDFSRRHISKSGLADERGYYYQALGLRPVLRRGTWVSHPWLLEGYLLRPHAGWYTRCSIGMVAYAAGPEARWIDPLALTEPFLARLPSRSGARVGHYERAFPAGYLDSMLRGDNRVVDPLLRALYADVHLAARAPWASVDRLGAIWRLSIGYHDIEASDFDKNAVGLPGVRGRSSSPFACYGITHGSTTTWKLSGPPLSVSRVKVRDR